MSKAKTKPLPLHRDAKLVAKMLEADLVMAAQVKEHIKPERLVEILGITAPEVEEATLSEATEEQLKAELAERFAK